MTPFKTFNDAHLIALALIFVLCMCFVLVGKRQDEKSSFRLRLTIAALLLGGELTEMGIALYSGAWQLSWALPLHLCDLSLYALVIALMWKKQIAWELAYFWGLGGSIPAVITPEIPFNFPYFIFVTFFIHHGAIIAGALYLATIKMYPLPFSSLKRIWLITHAYAGMIFVFNIVMGSNYLFLLRKPTQPTLLDYLGPWPVYLLGLEILFLIAIFLLYKLYHFRIWDDRKLLK